VKLDDLPDSSVGKLFAARFGVEEANAVLAAGLMHRGQMHRDHARLGSDPFKTCLAFVIGLECYQHGGYLEEHGLRASWEDVKAWIIEKAEMRTHDGDFDGFALLMGVYNEYVGSKPFVEEEDHEAR